MTASAPPIHPPPRKRKRPFGINAIIVLSTLQFLFAVAIAAVFYLDSLSAVSSWANGTIDRWLVVFLTSTSGVQIAIIIGLWRLKRWGWFLVMLTNGLSMFLNIWAYFYSRPNYIAMLVSVVIVLYMNQREVQQTFRDPTQELPSA